MKKTGSLFHTLACLYGGQSLLRIRMNEALSRHALTGRVLDVGGGREPDYFDYFQKEADAVVEMVDGSVDRIDFERDPLPRVDGSIDTVILANVLEHIYNYEHLLAEVRRILAEKGTLIGFVPFWIGYHPDPHDYFRYTDEALLRMLGDAGFTDVRIEPLAVGPILANFNTIALSFPRLMRPALYLLYVPWNALFLALRPKSALRNPLGFVFSARPALHA